MKVSPGCNVGSAVNIGHMHVYCGAVIRRRCIRDMRCVPCIKTRDVCEFSCCDYIVL